MFSRFLILSFLLFPIFSHAQILFSEIAWMGTDVSDDDEWIELFNHDLNMSGPGTDVEGWTLTDGDDINITLHGMISPMTIILLERTDDTSVPGVSAFQTYTGSLKNSGETLTLKDASGATVAEVVGGTDWANIGGSNAIPRKTAQQAQAGWVTGTPTPGAENVAHDDMDESTQAPPSEPASNMSTTKSGGGGSSRKTTSASKTEDFETKPELKLGINAPKTAYINQPVVFTAVPTGVGRTIESSLKYTWNFGDTYTGTGKSGVHVFTHPGEYIIFLEGTFGNQYATVRHEVKVLPVSFTMTRTETGDIRIENNAPYEVDIGGFAITGTRTFVFPKFTILKSKGVLTVGKERIGSTHTASLYDNARVRTASVGQGTIPARVTTPTQAVSVATATDETPISKSHSTGEIPSQTVIQIGANEDSTPEKRNIFTRFMGGVVRFFGL